MNILFLPNWVVKISKVDLPETQCPDKYIIEKPYWFFRHFTNKPHVDVIDIQPNNCLHKIENKIKFYIWQAFLAYKVQNKYDVIISHGAQSGLVLSLLRTLTFCKSPKHIIFDIGGMNGGRNNKIEIAMIKFALLSNPSIICHSKIIIDNYKKHFQNLVSKTKFIPFGCNTEEFCPKKNVTEKNQIIAFGYAKRDYHTLIEAFKRINHPDVKLKIIGLPHPLEEAKGNPFIEIIPKVPIEMLKQEIQASKFVIIPLPVFDYSYGQMSFLQSMSLGKAVIVTDTPSSADYHLPQQKAFTAVKPYDIEDMKEKIENFLNNKQLLIEATNEARPYVRNFFSEERMGKEIEQFIHNIIDKNRQVVI